MLTGNLLFGELTALYKIGKWSLGPVGYFVAQTTADRPGGGVACTPAICGFQSQVDAGFLIGYDFGPAAVQVWADNTLECKNCIGYGWDSLGPLELPALGPRGHEASRRQELGERSRVLMRPRGKPRGLFRLQA
jgi:hypothetical protein